MIYSAHEEMIGVLKRGKIVGDKKEVIPGWNVLP